MSAAYLCGHPEVQHPLLSKYIVLITNIVKADRSAPRLAPLPGDLGPFRNSVPCLMSLRIVTEMSLMDDKERHPITVEIGRLTGGRLIRVILLILYGVFCHHLIQFILHICGL